MKALSIRQPWAWAILHAGKRIENRSRRINYRGPLLIHASASGSRLEAANILDWMQGCGLAATPPRFDELPRGAIVGVAEVVATHTWHDSHWFIGPFGLELANVRVFAEPIPYKGQLGLFDVPDELVRKAIEEARDVG